MPPTDDANRPARPVESFRCKAVSSVAFKAAADHNGTHTTVLKMTFEATYKPPIMTFRFNINVAGLRNGEKVQTRLYMDIPTDHILSLEQVNNVHAITTPEIGPCHAPTLSNGDMCVLFVLRSPATVVSPPGEFAYKPASMSTLSNVLLLAAAREFALYLPHKALSNEKLECLRQGVLSTASSFEKEAQKKEHDRWRRALYGGTGGRVADMPDDTALSVLDLDGAKCDDRSVNLDETSDPLTYKPSAVNHGDAYATAAPGNSRSEMPTLIPPPYSLGSDGDEKPFLNFKGSQREKRLRELGVLRAEGLPTSVYDAPASPDIISPSPERMVQASRFETQPDSFDVSPPSLTGVLSNLAHVLSTVVQQRDNEKSPQAELLAMRKRLADMETERELQTAYFNGRLASHDQLIQRHNELANRFDKLVSTILATRTRRTGLGRIRTRYAMRRLSHSHFNAPLRKPPLRLRRPHRRPAA